MSITVYASVETALPRTRQQWLNGVALFYAHPRVEAVRNRANDISEHMQIIAKCEPLLLATRAVMCFRVPDRFVDDVVQYIETRLGRPMGNANDDFATMLEMVAADVGLTATVTVIARSADRHAAAATLRQHLLDNAASYYGN